MIRIKNYLANSYKSNKKAKASKFPHRYVGDTTIVEYQKKSGARTFYKSKKGTNTGIKATLYSAPNSQKGSYGAVVRVTERKFYHANSMADLMKKLGV
jgi:hypothetical protein